MSRSTDWWGPRYRGAPDPRPWTWPYYRYVIRADKPKLGRCGCGSRNCSFRGNQAETNRRRRHIEDSRLVDSGLQDYYNELELDNWVGRIED